VLLIALRPLMPVHRCQNSREYRFQDERPFDSDNLAMLAYFVLLNDEIFQYRINILTFYRYPQMQIFLWVVDYISGLVGAGFAETLWIYPKQLEQTEQELEQERQSRQVLLEKLHGMGINLEDL
jgi:hypothetical protein